LSCCNLIAFPGELTYMTKLIELNLSTNQLKELPQAIGRMTRLVQLYLADNKLTDLPISLGLCIGLAKLGAGMSIDRNPMKDPELFRKYKIGTDHLQDYLEKKMMITDGFKLLDYDIARWDELKPKEEPKIERKSQVMAPATPTVDWQMNEKIKALKRWANSTIQADLRPKVTNLQTQLEKATEMDQVTKFANIMKLLKPEMEKARPQVPPYDVPKPTLEIGIAKIDMLKNVVRAGLTELSTLTRVIQEAMNKSNENKDVIGMVQIIKSIKTILDKV